MKTLHTLFAVLLGFTVSAQTENCCINPAWIDPLAACLEVYDPVEGCDGVEYSNSCFAQAAGVTSWENSAGEVYESEWDCTSNPPACCINPAWIDPLAACVEIYDPVVGCNGVEYSNSCVAEAAGVTSWENSAGEVTEREWDCASNPVLCETPSGIIIYTVGDWTNPDNPCEAGYCGPDGYFSQIVFDCPYEMGIPCDGDLIQVPGQCCSECVEEVPLCTSSSGIEIYEEGTWINPSNPCDAGHCNADGTFSMMIIDCAQAMGVECNGEWVEVEGQCCSECVEVSASSTCGGVSITLNQGWNMIGFGCESDKNATSAFNAIKGQLIIAKNGNGDAYLADWDYNGIGDLKRGYGYLIKVTEEISNYNICD